MTLRLGALHDALSNPGDQELARKAAEEVAGYENRLASIESRLTVLTWMVGVVIILVTGVFWQGFAIMGRLPR
jgi:hypothetical protein